MLSVEADGLKPVWETAGPCGGPRLGGAKNKRAGLAGDWSIGGGWTVGRGTEAGSDQTDVTGMATPWGMIPLSGGTGSALMAIDTLPPYSSHGVRSLLDSKRILRRAQPAQAVVRIKADTIRVGNAGNRIGKDSVPRTTVRAGRGESVAAHVVCHYPLQWGNRVIGMTRPAG